MLTTTAHLKRFEHDLAEACHAAKREMPVVGTLEHPTPWDMKHQRINTVLDDWQSARV